MDHMFQVIDLSVERELTWDDLGQMDIDRFSSEEHGRAFAANYTWDPYTDVLRQVYHSCKHRYGKSGLFISDLIKAKEECERRTKEVNDEIKERLKREKEWRMKPSSNSSGSNSSGPKFVSLGK